MVAFVLCSCSVRHSCKLRAALGYFILLPHTLSDPTDFGVGGMDRAICRCGHSRDAHEHYRPGGECALCPAEGCQRFRRARWWNKRGVTTSQS
jgi:hypothetical protein